MPSIDLGWIVGLVSKINLATPTWDLFILLFFLVGSLVYGLSMGRERVVMLIVAIYMDLAVVNNAPYLHTFKANISLGQAFAFQITTFVSVFLVLFFLLSKTALARSFSLDDHGKWWQILLFSTLHVGLLTSVILSYLPPSALAHLTMVTRQIFTSDTGKFVWIILPIAAMILIKGEKQKQ
ncbi:hypothetical protein EPN90_03310 [Patescibacteria group bacterium]|nr:MAG: hypothetical protein EPN90_03310 [Patescibacteria group bacterium]